MDKIIDFYTGYEGEPEIIFYFENAEDKHVQLKVWIGHFDAIMLAITPNSNGWKGLSRYYQTDTGWFEESPWKIPDLDDALHNIQYADSAKLDHTALLVYHNLCELLHQAKIMNQNVWIEYS